MIIKIFSNIDTAQNDGTNPFTGGRKDIERGFPVTFHTILLQMDRPIALIYHIKTIIIACKMSDNFVDLTNIVKRKGSDFTIELHRIGRKDFTINPHRVNMVAVDRCNHKQLTATTGYARSRRCYRTAKSCCHMLRVHNSLKHHLHTMIGCDILQNNRIVLNLHLLSVHKHFTYLIAIIWSDYYGEPFSACNHIHSSASHGTILSGQHLHRIFVY